MTDPDRPIRTDADLVAHVDDLVGVALRRQTWILFFDDEDRPIPTVVPMDGIPVDPDPEDIATLAERLRMLVDATSAASLALVWERPGDAVLRMQEADWIAGVAAADAPVRAQLLASDEGVRLLDPEFEALVA